MKIFAFFLIVLLLLPSIAAVCQDNDEDGFTGEVSAGCPQTVDCDDTDDTVSPNAVETCDEIDNNCDGVIDEGCANEDPANQSQEDNASSQNEIQEPILPENCALTNVQWLDNTGQEMDLAVDGDSIFLSTSANDCEGATITFAIVEYDGVDPNTGELLATQVEAISSVIANNGASVEWPALYEDDEPEVDVYGYEDYYPEYLLFAAINNENPIILEAQTLLKVIPP